jgi:hypothetical protein
MVIATLVPQNVLEKRGMNVENAHRPRIWDLENDVLHRPKEGQCLPLMAVVAGLHLPPCDSTAMKSLGGSIERCMAEVEGICIGGVARRGMRRGGEGAEEGRWRKAHANGLHDRNVGCTIDESSRTNRIDYNQRILILLS